MTLRVNIKPGDPLDEEEIRMLECIAEGYYNSDLAREFNYSKAAITNRLTAIYIKLDIRDINSDNSYRYKIQAVVLAMRKGLIT